MGSGIPLLPYDKCRLVKMDNIEQLRKPKLTRKQCLQVIEKTQSYNDNCTLNLEWPFQ